MNGLVNTIGGIGIGSIIASIVTQYLNAKEKQKELIFTKKEKAYLGLLEALYLNEINEKEPQNYGHWHNITALVGSPETIKFSQNLIDSKPSTEERRVALNNLKQAMRNDLKIDKRKLI